ncbi:MAG: DsrE/DsrF/TusD sulfur relay family protein [Thermoleophilia bacterium]
MATALIVNASPYGTETPYNALRLAGAIAVRDEFVELFLLGDGVHLARGGQDPRDAHASLEAMLRELLERGVVVTACGTCCQTRGLVAGDLVDGVAVGTIHDLAALVARSDRTLTF